MKKNIVAGAAVALLVTAAVVVSWRRTAGRIGVPAATSKGPVPSRAPIKTNTEATQPVRTTESSATADASKAPVLSAAEKAARIAKIKRDYDEIRTKASADYTAAGASFPGGLNAFLRQLALLEREKRADFATVLTPRELEDLEMRETTAGNLVERLLGATRATLEQRRAVFQLQRAFEDQFALTFDVTPRALLERESARQQTQEKIRTVLGDELFSAWLHGEGEDYAQNVAFAARNNLPPGTALELWRAKNDYTVRRLELTAQKSGPEQQRAAQAALAQQIEARVMQIVGPALLQDARKDVLGWMPKR